MELIAPYFSLKNTLECGQFFRFKNKGDSYLVQVRDIAFLAKQKGDRLYVKGAEESFVRNLFRLDEDFRPIKKAILNDPHTRKAYLAYPGIRLMRQDPWECMVSYICSQVSNIPKIQSSLDAISKTFGKPFSFDNQQLYAFPKPGSLNCTDSLRSCGVGFRADYLNLLNGQSKALLKDLNKGYEKDKERLMQCKGIGDKVAECILLFSLGYDQAFPIDIWIRRAMHTNYLKAPDSELRRYMAEKFSGYAGYAQQYLFMYTRLTS
ncbi:MAG: DNA-3-methyladenine glycosylase family protein [Candidatus Woesearchaeota archaeon]